MNEIRRFIGGTSFIRDKKILDIPKKHYASNKRKRLKFLYIDNVE